MLEHIANIGDLGERRRRLGGWIWLGVSIVALAVLLVAHAPRWSRFALVVPVALAGLGFLQAREKT